MHCSMHETISFTKETSMADSAQVTYEKGKLYDLAKLDQAQKDLLKVDLPKNYITHDEKISCLKGS